MPTLADRMAARFERKQGVNMPRDISPIRPLRQQDILAPVEKRHAASRSGPGTVAQPSAARVAPDTETPDAAGGEANNRHAGA